MNKEIQEILDGLNIVIKQEGSLELDSKECKKILDCITNLRKENKRLNEWIDNRNDYIDFLNTQNDRLRNMIVFDKLQRRIDEAIELLKEAGCYDEEAKTFCDDIWEELPKLLNILQGSDE